MAPCGPRWHRLTQPDGHAVWFRLAVRMADEHGTYIYRLGPEPDDASCRTIWCYGDGGVPWTCSACGSQIDSKRYRPPVGDAPSHRSGPA